MHSRQPLNISTNTKCQPWTGCRREPALWLDSNHHTVNYTMFILNLHLYLLYSLSPTMSSIILSLFGIWTLPCLRCSCVHTLLYLLIVCFHTFAPPLNLPLSKASTSDLVLYALQIEYCLHASYALATLLYFAFILFVKTYMYMLAIECVGTQ